MLIGRAFHLGGSIRRLPVEEDERSARPKGRGGRERYQRGTATQEPGSRREHTEQNRNKVNMLVSVWVCLCIVGWFWCL